MRKLAAGSRESSPRKKRKPRSSRKLMRRNIVSTLWISTLWPSTLCLSVLLAGAAATVSAQPVARAARAGKTGDSFLSGAPFTLEQAIRIIGQDAIPLRRRKEAIENRGVDFSMSAAAVARLKAA